MSRINTPNKSRHNLPKVTTYGDFLIDEAYIMNYNGYMEETFMKIKLLIFSILICFTISGCSDANKTTSRNNTTVAQTDTASSNKESKESNESNESNEKTDIVLSLNNINFNLSSKFEDTDLGTLTSKDLSILRNAIYAKYGYTFSTKEFSEYFSKFSWYKPTSKSVEGSLDSIDKENIKKIVALESKKNTVIKRSKDNKDYSEDGKVDISLNEKKETLYITKEAIKDSEESATNFPTRVTLKIKDSKVVFESLWNDGIGVSTADFDTTDKCVDIYITRAGTDIGCETTIYKFDGQKLYKYCEFNNLLGRFLYDEKGNIYYWFNNSDKHEINKCYNYKTKESSDITDKNLKAELNKVKFD